MKTLIAISISLFLAYSGTSQITYEKRLEFELKDDYSSERILDFGEDGMMLQALKDDRDNGQKEWRFEMYSTDLVLEKTETFLIDKNFYLSESVNTERFVHTLYKTKKNFYQLHTIQGGTLEQFTTNLNFPKSTIVETMTIVGETAFFYTRLKKYRNIYAVDWRTGKIKSVDITVPGYSGTKLRDIRLQYIQETNEVIFFLRAIKNKKENSVHAFRFDHEGNLIKKFTLAETEDYNFTSISASGVSEGHYVYTGTYAKKGAGSSEGLFFCETQGGEMTFSKFYSFIDLENFLKYLPASKQAKIEKKKERKADRGKELSINYLIAEHPVLVLNDGYLFLGEAYYPTYRTETTTKYVNGSPVTTTQQVFDGYQYTHAVLAKFNKKGEMLWDQIFEMYPSQKPFYVKRFISIAQGNQDALKLVFASRNRIVSKSFGFDGEVISNETSEPIETQLEGDQTKRSFANIDYWYDKYFLAYGTQKIKNTENKGNRKRTVFFISKIKFE